jgi:hypothetical protein
VSFAVHGAVKVNSPAGALVSPSLVGALLAADVSLLALVLVGLPVLAPDGPVVAAVGPVVAPVGPVGTPVGPDVLPVGPVVAPVGPVGAPVGPLTGPVGPVVGTTGVVVVADAVELPMGPVVVAGGPPPFESSLQLQRLKDAAKATAAVEVTVRRNGEVDWIAIKVLVWRV